MRTYQLFKTIDNYKCEDYMYLHQITNTQHRIALTKLRLSNVSNKPPEWKCIRLQINKTCMYVCM